MGRELRFLHRCEPRRARCGDALADRVVLIGLLAADRLQDAKSICRGCHFLVERQLDGGWEKPEITGAGFPGYGVGHSIRLDDPQLQERLSQGPELSRAFMLRYDLYRHYFPLVAFGRALRRQRQKAITAELRVISNGLLTRCPLGR